MNKKSSVKYNLLFQAMATACGTQLDETDRKLACYDVSKFPPTQEGSVFTKLWRIDNWMLFLQLTASN